MATSYVPNSYDIVNQAIAASMGAEYAGKTGTINADNHANKLVDIGDAITGANKTESFFNSMLSLIGSIEVENTAYTGDLSDIMVKDLEWGGFVESTMFDLATIVDDPKWNLAANAALTPAVTDYSSIEHGFVEPKSDTKVFGAKKTKLMAVLSNPTDQLHEAVRNMGEMEKIIGGMHSAVNNTVTLGINSIKHMITQMAIAATCGTLMNSGSGTAVHLLDLTDALGITTSSDTAETAIQNPAALAFILQTIAEYRDNMAIMGKSFSTGAVATFTPQERSRLVLLNKFDKACRFRVKANTFNKDDLAIGQYSTVSDWQGIVSTDDSNPFSLANVSRVRVKKDTSDTSDEFGVGLKTHSFDARYCIGLLFDRKALGVCPYKRKVTSKYTASADFLNEFYHVMCGTKVDPRYNIVSFFLDRAADWEQSGTPTVYTNMGTDYSN